MGLSNAVAIGMITHLMVAHMSASCPSYLQSWFDTPTTCTPQKGEGTAVYLVGGLSGFIDSDATLDELLQVVPNRQNP